ncbi:MAG: hypothetical protein KUL80_05190 [Comamonas sp.]|nr:hypothetical protein [Comamonas sp.]
MKLPSLLAMFGLTALLLSVSAHADDGHGHGEAAPVASGPALARFTAASDAFELVGVLNGRNITLYLDRTADNVPVVDAQIELEIAGEKHVAQPHEDFYEVELAVEPAPGTLPIAATVKAGEATDLLTGELDHHDEDAEHADRTRSWPRYAAWAAGLVAAFATLFTLGRRMASSRSRCTGGAA